MIVKLTKEEQKTLKALDPKSKGSRPWQTAREVSGGVFRKNPEKIEQWQIRAVRNAFRKIVREGLVEMSPTERGKYRISAKGRKILSSGSFEFEGKFERGEAVESAKKASKERGKKAPKKAAPKKAAPKKAPKKAAPKKAAPKKASKEKSKKAAPKRKAEIEVVDKTKNGAKAGSSNGSGTERKKPVFKRKKALQYANRNSE